MLLLYVEFHGDWTKFIMFCLHWIHFVGVIQCATLGKDYIDGREDKLELSQTALNQPRKFTWCKVTTT